MEVIRIPGYTEDEKLNIALRYLLPKQLEAHGLNEEELQISKAVLIDIIRYYTRESGVRNLEREIAKICRKAVKQLALEKDKEKIAATTRNLDSFLGVRRFRYGVVDENNEIGQVTGLAWTEVGGELLHIEATMMPGKGRLIQTGQLGDVMQESIQAAMTVVRSRAERLGIEPGFYQTLDAHIHVPEGATPKDGPSAGLKEKLLAAHRGGIKTVLIPEENEKDLVEISKVILRKLDVHPVSTVDQVLELALTEMPKPLPAAIEGKKDEAGKTGDVVTTH